jgi:hypothetical protein
MKHYIVTIVNPRCVREFTVIAPCLIVTWEMAEKEAGPDEIVMAVAPVSETAEAA